jgi:4-deoxy-L-threo-5-hexosulose-uronate ketol-isomerase
MASFTSGFGQQTVSFQKACHPDDVKHYDTQTLRDRFVMEKVMAADEINLTYSMYDRFIFGGAMPVTKDLKLETFPELRADYFMRNRELGIINTGGDGVVIVDGQEYPLGYSEALYVGRGWLGKD